MPKRVQRIGHETNAAAAFTGLEREITIDLGKKSSRVHDGITPGGTLLAKEDLSTSPVAVGGTNDGKMSSAQALEVANSTIKDSTQDTRLDSIEALNITQDTRLGSIETINTTQDTRLTATELIANGASVHTPVVTAGTPSAYTVNLGITSYEIGRVYEVFIHVSNAINPTIAMDGLLALDIEVVNSFGAVLGTLAGELPTNYIAKLYYNGGFFILLNPSDEIGTFSPELWDNSLSGAEGQTYSINAGAYTRNFREVNIALRFQLSSLGTLSGTIVHIGNLPYVSKNASLILWSFTLGLISGLTLTGKTGVSGRMSQNRDYITLNSFDSNGNTSQIAISEISATSSFSLSGTYSI